MLDLSGLWALADEAGEITAPMQVPGDVHSALLEAGLIPDPYWSSGDMHFWSVWHEGRDFEHYREVRPRFCSEGARAKKLPRCRFRICFAISTAGLCQRWSSMATR